MSKTKAQLQAENDKLRAALLKVSHVSVIGDGHHCPWCKVAMALGHADDCQRQAALKGND